MNKWQKGVPLAPGHYIALYRKRSTGELGRQIGYFNGDGWFLEHHVKSESVIAWAHIPQIPEGWKYGGSNG